MENCLPPECAGVNFYLCLKTSPQTNRAFEADLHENEPNNNNNNNNNNSTYKAQISTMFICTEYRLYKIWEQ